MKINYLMIMLPIELKTIDLILYRGKSLFPSLFHQHCQKANFKPYKFYVLLCLNITQSCQGEIIRQCDIVCKCGREKNNCIKYAKALSATHSEKNVVS